MAASLRAAAAQLLRGGAPVPLSLCGLPLLIQLDAGAEITGDALLVLTLLHAPSDAPPHAPLLRVAVAPGEAATPPALVLINAAEREAAEAWVAAAQARLDGPSNRTMGPNEGGTALSLALEALWGAAERHAAGLLALLFPARGPLPAAVRAPPEEAPRQRPGRTCGAALALAIELVLEHAPLTVCDRLTCRAVCRPWRLVASQPCFYRHLALPASATDDLLLLLAQLAAGRHASWQPAAGAPAPAPQLRVLDVSACANVGYAALLAAPQRRRRGRAAPAPRAVQHTGAARARRHATAVPDAAAGTRCGGRCADYYGNARGGRRALPGGCGRDAAPRAAAPRPDAAPAAVSQRARPWQLG